MMQVKNKTTWLVSLVIVYLVISDGLDFFLNDLLHLSNSLTVTILINVVFSIFIIQIYKRQVTNGLHIKPKILLIIIPVIGLLSIELYDFLTMSILNVNPGVSQSSFLGEVPSCLLVPFVLVFAPITEELIFQQIIQGQLLTKIFKKENRFSKWIRILIVTFLFSLVHGFSWGLGDLKTFVVTVIYYFDLIFLAIIYEYSDRNITLTIFTHVLANALATMTF